MELLLRFIGMVMKVLNILSTPFLVISGRYFYRPIKVPPIKNELLRLAAIDLAEKIRNKEVRLIAPNIWLEMNLIYFFIGVIT